MSTVEKGNTKIEKREKFELPFQHDPIFQNVEISLEEILTGIVKPIEFQRKVIDSNKNEYLENKTIVIDIKPGTKSGQKMNYPKEGHFNDMDKLQGDVIFVIKDKPHEFFTRNGADIEFTAFITKLEAKYGLIRNIPSLECFELDGSLIPLDINEKILPNSSKIIPGHGLPLPENPTLRGNLIVKFKIDEKGNHKKIIKKNVLKRHFFR